MASLPVLTAIEVIRGLKKAGFVFDRQAKGSHEIWYNPATKRRTTVPNHPGVDIRKGTLKAILKEAGISVEEFMELIG
jgi:predicted RNA binding protein YcfA (HicA-like mRNA interferase family)